MTWIAHNFSLLIIYMKRNSLNAAVLSKPSSVFYLRTSKQDIIKEGTGYINKFMESNFFIVASLGFIFKMELNNKKAQLCLRLSPYVVSPLLILYCNFIWITYAITIICVCIGKNEYNRFLQKPYQL